MELQGEQLIPTSQQRTWDALNDPDTLKACIAGCDSLERTPEGGFTALMTLRVGPVSAKFKGQLTLSDVQAPHSYTIHFDGQGGMAGFGKGSAQVRLTPADGGTLLSYAAKAQVGGKLAQVGSRLVDAAAGKITNDFFAAFCERARADAQAAGELATPAVGAAVPAQPAGSGVPVWVWWGLAAAAAAAAAFALAR